MKRLVSALFVEAGVFYVAMIYSSKSMLYLSIWILLLLFLLCAYHLIVAGKLRVIIEVPVPFGGKNESFPFRIRLVNRSFLPTGKVVMQVRARYLLSGITRKMEVCCSVPGRGLSKLQGEVCLNGEWIPEYIGGVCLEVVKAVRYDYFGILGFRIRRKFLEIGEQVAVLPMQQELALSFGDERTMRYTDKETDMSVFGEKNPPEISDIREYRAGDRIRSIHWKLSAKRDELMVYEFISEQPPAVVVFLEPWGTDKKKNKTRKKRRGSKYKKEIRKMERHVAFLYSLSMALLDKNCGHYIAYYDCNRACTTRKTIGNEEELYDFIKDLKKDMLQIGVAVEQLQEEYRGKYQRTAGNTELVLHKDLSCTYEEEVLAVWEAGVREDE
ncbi:MAG: DUF58 domain-containing protein [Lachnospiraceae bacterium]|nr:DUF58 domain-containing protein [Lachnospiraceae bacterium]